MEPSRIRPPMTVIARTMPRSADRRAAWPAIHFDETAADHFDRFDHIDHFDHNRSCRP